MTNPKHPVPHEIPAGEWLGLVVEAPAYVAGEGGPQRLALALWLELPSGLIVGQQMLDPAADPAPILAQLLADSFAAPLAGKPRKPAALRVQHEAQAKAIRALTGDRPPVRVAPIPEVEPLLDSMREFLSGPEAAEGREQPSYLAAGRVEADTVGDLFRSAGVFRALAPWKVLLGREPVRVDIPELEVEGACVVSIGAEGAPGFMMFPSLDHCERFMDAAGEAERAGQLPRAIGTTVRVFTLERGADLPDPMRREVVRHGWSVDDAESFPVVDHRDADSLQRPLEDLDVRIVTAVASALATFVLRVGSGFERKNPKPISESYASKVTVRVTWPYDARSLFEGPSDGGAKAHLVEAIGTLTGAMKASGRSFDWAVGVLAGAATHPSMRVMPSSWLPLLLGEKSPVPDEELPALMNGVMELYNDVAHGLDAGEIYIPDGRRKRGLAEWCDGYWRALMLDDAWTAAADATLLLEPVREVLAPREGKRRRGLRQFVVDAVIGVHDRFREMRLEELGAARVPHRRGRAKVGRNEACPCGSGLKAKKCCLRGAG